jgi:type IV secretory pathway component VirB8
LQITRPSHPPEQIRTIEEADEEKSITAPSSEQSSGTLEVNLRSTNYCVVVLALNIALATVVVLALKIPLATVVVVLINMRKFHTAKM